MSSARTYLRKTLPMVPPVLVEIEDSPSAETTSGAPFVGAFGRCLPSFNRPLRNEISIRNVLRNRISRDWRSFSRLRGLRAFFYVPESYPSVVLIMKVFAACDDFDSEKRPPACAFPCVLCVLCVLCAPCVLCGEGFWLRLR